MSARIAAYDWSRSVLGDPETWPQSLRTAVRVVLTSRFAMWMAWGPQLTVFYNDAYARDTLASKHPWALGRPAREVWAEIWPDIGPRIDRVMGTGEATWDEALCLFLERSGYREETFHTFSYSPLVDDDGATAGMLCVVAEETDRVLGERRMGTLRELAIDLAAPDSETELWRGMVACLGRNSHDIPFALAFLAGPGGEPRLVARAGVPEHHPLLERARSTLAAGAAEVVDLTDLEGVPTGPWPDPPAQAAVVRLGAEGEGWLVCGLNPYRALDTAAQGFLDLFAAQVGAALVSARRRQADRERAEALAELDRAKTEFFSNVSHEFRTPLTLIAGPADDAAADTADPLPEAQRARVEIIRRNARRLRRLVDTMLDFSRIEAGRLEPDLVAVDLAALTRGVAESFAPAVQRAGLELRIDCADLGGPAVVDVEMWEKVVLNLLSNALKFTLNGAIDLHLADDGDGPVLTVADTGVGISADQLPQLFDRFHRARPARARSHEGTGIGLALVRELVGLHGGTIEASSDGSAGSVFTVRLPVAEHGAPAAHPVLGRDTAAAFVDEALHWSAGAEPAAAGVFDGTVGAVAGARVLVVEDNADLRRFIRGLLARHFDVHVASDGAQALALAREIEPELVVSDVMMPGLDGFALLAALRAEPALAGVPVILLSARAGEEAAAEGLQAGADDYLVKPFSSQDLVARVRSNLELSRLRTAEIAWRETLVRAMQDGYAVASPDGTITEMNAGFAQIVGYPADGVPYPMPHPWWPDRDRAPDDYRQVVECVNGATGPAGGGRWVLPLRHADGRRLWVSVSIATVTDAAGVNEARVVTARDVTDEHRVTLRARVAEVLEAHLAGATEVEAVLEAAAAAVTALWPARRAALITWDEGGEGRVRGADRPWAEVPEAWWQVLAEARQVGRPHVAEGLVAAPVAFGDDVAVIATRHDAAFDEHEVELLDEFAQRLGQPLTRARLYEEQRSTSIALQRAILGPSDLPEGFAVCYEPAGSGLEVGGDWYDVVPIAEGCTGVVVGDCVGRGVHAAAAMGQLRSACRALLLESKDPGAVMTSMDDVAGMIPGARCTTVFCATIAADSGTLTYSCAGHLPGILVHADGSSELLDGAGRVPLASFAADPVEAKAELRAGSLVVLYTDGLVERRDRDIVDGIENLRATVVGVAGRPAAAVADLLASQLVPAAHDDDVAYLVYRHPG